MEKLLKGALLLLSFAFQPTVPKFSSTTPQEKVYICDSRTAYVYHRYKDCKGLKACTHEIRAVSEQEAVNVYRRRKCKICY
jgi:hypothetical protein